MGKWKVFEEEVLYVPVMSNQSRLSTAIRQSVRSGHGLFVSVSRGIERTVPIGI